MTQNEIDSITPEIAVDVFRQMKSKYVGTGEDHDAAARCLIVLREFGIKARENEKIVASMTPPVEKPVAAE